MLNEETFFSLLDSVLKAAGRAPLEPNNRSIVQVQAQDRVLQILAGPGSGKTEMLVWRVLYELFVRNTPARRIMVTTFTRKAATELNVRVVERSDGLIEMAREWGVSVHDPHVHDLRIGTIHSLCDALLAEFDLPYMEKGTRLIDEHECMIRLLRAHRYKLGYSGNTNAPRTVDRLLACEPLVALFRAPWDENARWPSNSMHRVELLLRLLGLHTETWIPRCQELARPNGLELTHGYHGLTRDLGELRRRWTDYLESNSIVDFTTLQHAFYERQQGLVHHLDHVLVDEFQDTNPLQFAIHAGWLASPKLRLTVVGDDDQSLYRFRGSDSACFRELGPHCARRDVRHRLEKLEKNWRSTTSIVEFTQAFKAASALSSSSMDKRVVPGNKNTLGVSTRLLRGPWDAICNAVAAEVRHRGAADPTKDISTAMLAFSTSEKAQQSPAKVFRESLERVVRVYNPRNKTAGRADSPVAELLGLLSYLVDPITKAPLGKAGRLVEVWASHEKYGRHARSKPPDFRVNQSYIDYQKRFLKADRGTIAAPASNRRELVNYIDEVRNALASASSSPKPPRLTLAGLVARLLSFPRYRDAGYEPKLFRQALFTEILDANIAPTRMTMNSLDSPLYLEVENNRWVWPPSIWTFISYFGALVEESDLDDPEVDAFQENALLVLTFHQSKGLEFDHVYVAGTGRGASHHNVLQTMAFSGETVAYELSGSQPISTNSDICRLALADRDRELYVAMTRARHTLTFLHDPDHESPLMRLDPILEKLFSGGRGRPHPDVSHVEIIEDVA